MSAIEKISNQEVTQADQARWRGLVLRHGVTDPYTDRIPPNKLFSGPNADKAEQLLDVLYSGVRVEPDTELSPGVTAASVLGENANDNLKTLRFAFSRRQRILDGERRLIPDEAGGERLETVWRVGDRCIVIGDPTNREKWLRTLPFAPSNTHHIEGLGSTVLQSVGDTSYTSGIYVYFHRDGEEEAEPGYMSWSASFDEDCRFVWRRNAIRGLMGPDIDDPEIVAAVERLIEQMPERNPVSWMFHAKGAIHRTLDRYERERRETESSIVDLEAAKAGESGHRWRGQTLEQIDNSLAYDRKRLAKMDVHADRFGRLRKITNTIRAWMDKDSPEHQMSIRDLIVFAPAAGAEPAVEVPGPRL